MTATGLCPRGTSNLIGRDALVFGCTTRRESLPLINLWDTEFRIPTLRIQGQDIRPVLRKARVWAKGNGVYRWFRLIKNPTSRGHRPGVVPRIQDFRLECYEHFNEYQPDYSELRDLCQAEVLRGVGFRIPYNYDRGDGHQDG